MKPFNLLNIFLILLLFSFLISHFSFPAKAVDCNNPGSLGLAEINQCLEEKTQWLRAVSSAYETNKRDLKIQENELTKSIQQLDNFSDELDEKQKQLILRNKDFNEEYDQFSFRVRSFYIGNYNSNILTSIIGSHNVGEALRNVYTFSFLAKRNKGKIVNLVTSITELQKEKEMLNQAIAQTKNLKTSTEAEVKKLRNSIISVEQLDKQIAVLTVRQQEILAAKTGLFSTSVGDVPPADEAASRPDYNPGFSPAFAVFSFGAPHFKGMSQYGAFGRAKSGQNAEEILKAYYGGSVEIKKDYDAGKQIGVAGYGRMDIETYVKRIYEVPSSWGDEGGMEALKAQAVAARSYALAWTREGTGGNICTTENCQVYKNSNKGGRWEEAVNATRGWVLVKDGKIISAWYASTSGGYQESYNALAYLQDGSGFLTPSFWDTSNGRNGWTSQAYEKISGSPWFYKAWYRDRSGNSCGRSHPWLTSEEMADIINAWVVLYQGGGDSSRITPTSSCWGGNPYSTAELRSIGGYTDVSGFLVTYADAGVTASVAFQTNKGNISINGSDFKKAFNLRAPGRISLMSGLFNIEKK